MPGMPPALSIPSPMAAPAPYPATPPYGHALPVPYAPGAMTTPAFGMPALGHGHGAQGTIRTVVDVERDLLVAALTRYRGRIPAVARALGWSRGTIYNKMRKYQLEPDQFRDLP
jgi:DNA-binding NtrC family response regulator